MLRSQIRSAVKTNIVKTSPSSLSKRLLAGCAMAVLCLLPYAGTANARIDDADKADVFVIQVDGTNTLCREATPDEKSQFKKIQPKNLRQINHLEAQKAMELAVQQATVPHLTIILRATAHLDANPQAKAAFLRAAAAWE